MSKYTVAQVMDEITLLSSVPDGDTASAMLRDYAALLRERESAEAGVTDEMVNKACASLGIPPSGDDPFIDANDVRAALEAVAPMLASARVPEEMKSAPSSPLHPLWGDGFLRGWNACRDAMLAASPKPETIWPKNAREKAFSLAREMLKKGSAKPEKE